VVKILIAHAPRPLVEELIGRGHELIVAHYPGEWPVDQSGGSRCRFLPFPHRQKADPRAIHAIRRMVCEHRPHVIHAFSPRSLAATVLATIGIRPRPRITPCSGPPSSASIVRIFTSSSSDRYAIGESYACHGIATGVVGSTCRGSCRTAAGWPSASTCS